MQLLKIIEKNKASLCPMHQKNLDIVCMGHQTRICASCAIFGEHKNCNLREEQEVLNEIYTRTNSMVELFDLMEQFKKNFDA